ncbi:MAG: N-acetylmuramoyl-L-alanine amidase [Desulfobacula sp.]|uniref:N-acetylmuramoyl-L-alanine amidase family protein n=1 Tax=Desulfobacula sp. TaxID=2593537 RepID=UPI001D2594B7|nr:N-acetylmuramoyl-L-alanine amidase [Desulfobacula sp.]MBT3486388.1 N-acetylmuramoyl-L-alanine amidase [Desulfobacula sp.]MBT3805364.1 N-acetylmuramoyl-L-alanine amidase [Desulfobacula sp.]MBT4024518.1 N-acetylmuramoyl-L-alanine amidase [Desulfobacula sp.]MBT4199834.1 N-acetylmuramoyl-L-alanine amidase [Desulfobacula sp.]
MAKQTVFLFIITVLMIMPGTGFSATMIQTTQRIIVIDPGHGGNSSGLAASGGIKEKNIVLKLAQRTAQKLENHYNVILTRTEDISISQRERMFIANKNSADFFLSIHLNNSRDASSFLYYFDPPEPEKSKVHAAENTWKSQPLLQQAETKKAVNSFLNVFSAVKKINNYFSNGAPAIILEGATMPAILIEPISISILPPDTEETNAILDEYAVLIAKSIHLYFKKK